MNGGYFTLTNLFFPVGSMGNRKNYLCAPILTFSSTSAIHIKLYQTPYYTIDKHTS